MALAVLHELGRADQARARFASEACSAALLDLLTRHIRCPRTSSAGRLFDGAAGLLGMCTRMTAEAQAARALEAALPHATDMRTIRKPVAGLRP